jgi:hypothetical protein
MLWRNLGPDLSRKIIGSCLGAQNAASTHRSPQNSHSFTATAEVRTQAMTLGTSAPEDAVASERLHNNGEDSEDYYIPPEPTTT